MKASTVSPSILVGFVLLMAATPARAQDPIPIEWAGIWEIEITVYECDTNAVTFNGTALDTICPGDIFYIDDGGGTIDWTCTTSADENSLEYHCIGTGEVAPECTVQYVYDGNSTRTGESYTATATTTTTYLGDCFGIPNSCSRAETSGMRIAGAPSLCEGTPTEAHTWGAAKAAYR